MSYLPDFKKLVSIKGYNSDLMSVDYGVSQDFVLGPFLFLICIDDLHRANQQWKVHHFADNKDFFEINKSVKNLNKLVNGDMEHLKYSTTIPRGAFSVFPTIANRFLFICWMINFHKQIDVKHG